MQGTVRRIFPVAGYGFVEGEDGREFFFHISAMNGTDFSELAVGTPVEFEVRNRTTGDRPDEQPRAVNVHLGENAIPAVDNEPLPAGKVR
jgi:cold shock CspA family protein